MVFVVYLAETSTANDSNRYTKGAAQGGASALAAYCLRRRGSQTFVAAAATRAAPAPLLPLALLLRWWLLPLLPLPLPLRLRLLPPSLLLLDVHIRQARLALFLPAGWKGFYESALNTLFFSFNRKGPTLGEVSSTPARVLAIFWVFYLMIFLQAHGGGG